MSDLRESGAIEQDADLILFLHREDEIPEDGKMDLLIAKHRNGPVGELNLVFLKEYVRFDNYAPDVATMDVGAMH
ncbi:MAG: replicative DNA helicase, partial [Gammaproteobacteria bacterium]|nr:replicative DNA helicase [Gammaproteobacteria bacterium]